MTNEEASLWGLVAIMMLAALIAGIAAVVVTMQSRQAQTEHDFIVDMLMTQVQEADARAVRMEQKYKEQVKLVQDHAAVRQLLRRRNEDNITTLKHAVREAGVPEVTEVIDTTRR
jgi:Na+-translocating ferredoxin:NAD+ oxidoreductase RnfG subunit